MFIKLFDKLLMHNYHINMNNKTKEFYNIKKLDTTRFVLSIILTIIGSLLSILMIYGLIVLFSDSEDMSGLVLIFLIPIMICSTIELVAGIKGILRYRNQKSVALQDRKINKILIVGKLISLVIISVFSALFGILSLLIIIPLVLVIVILICDLAEAKRLSLLLSLNIKETTTELPKNEIDGKIEYCSNCGNKINNDSNYCKYCGKKLK